MSTTAKIVPIEKVWLTIRDCMAYLGVSRDFIDDVRNRGELSSYIVGRTVFIEKSELDALIESHRE